MANPSPSLDTPSIKIISGLYVSACLNNLKILCDISSRVSP